MKLEKWMGSAAAMPHQPFRWVPTSSKVGPTSISLISTAASLRLGHLLLQSSFKKLSHHLCGGLPRLKDVWCEKAAFQFKKINFLGLSNDGFASCMGLFFNGGENRRDLETSRRNSFGERPWTNVLLAINILIFIGQIASQGKLLMWGAKINSLIDKGQLWRLATSSFLHANIGHLMINCYSLNSIGPGVENTCGPKRYLALYFTSAITSSAVSYWFCKAPAVGASGAIFGLVGSFAVFVMRHRGLIKGGKDDLQHIARVIFLNMAIGLLSKGIDNWGHLGGLLGGAATSWLLGPVWKYESVSNDGRRIFVDRAPINYLIKRNREPKQLN